MTKQTFFSVMAIIAIIGIAGFLAACGGDTSPEFKTTFELTMLGKKITVIDDRTNPSKQLDELGIITKMQQGCDIRANLVNNAGEEAQQIYGGVLAKNITITVGNTGASYDGYKATDEKNLAAYIDYLISATKEQLDAAIAYGIGDIYNGNYSIVPIWLVGEVDGIPVYRVDGVSVADGEAALATYSEAYDLFGPLEKPIVIQKVDSVYFVSGSTVTLVGKTLKVGINATLEDMLNYIYDDIIYA